MIVLPIPTNTPFYKFRCTLDQQNFQFSVSWNMRAGWFLSMSDANGVVIFSSRRVVSGWDMLSFCSAPTRPRGALYCLDSTRKNETPGFADLGLRHRIVYVSPDEVAELEAEVASA